MPGPTCLYVGDSHSLRRVLSGEDLNAQIRAHATPTLVLGVIEPGGHEMPLSLTLTATTQHSHVHLHIYRCVAWLTALLYICCAVLLIYVVTTFGHPNLITRTLIGGVMGMKHAPKYSTLTVAHQAA